jgi:hypothetical protein
MSLSRETINQVTDKSISLLEVAGQMENQGSQPQNFQGWILLFLFIHNLELLSRSLFHGFTVWGLPNLGTSAPVTKQVKTKQAHQNDKNSPHKTSVV